MKDRSSEEGTATATVSEVGVMGVMAVMTGGTGGAGLLLERRRVDENELGATVAVSVFPDAVTERGGSGRSGSGSDGGGRSKWKSASQQSDRSSGGK